MKKDYYYLKYALKDLSNPDVDTVISGLSYGLYGIDQRLLNNAVNLSMHSQDLYYCIEGIISGFEKNRNIKKVVLIVGYYFFFSDLSLTRNMSELSRLTYTYMPLFNDTHNSLVIPSPNTYKMSSNIIDIDGVEELLAQTQYEKGYFNPDSPRFRGDIDWKTASMEEKESKKKNGSA